MRNLLSVTSSNTRGWPEKKLHIIQQVDFRILKFFIIHQQFSLCKLSTFASKPLVKCISLAIYLNSILFLEENGRRGGLSFPSNIDANKILFNEFLKGMGCQLCFLEELLKNLWGKQAKVPLLALPTANCETLGGQSLKC